MELNFVAFKAAPPAKPGGELRIAVVVVPVPRDTCGAVCHSSRGAR